MTIIMTIAIAMVLGLAIGSFVNVVISRTPKGESLVRPRSYCPSCRRQLAWWENVPVASYLLLSGRCRTCRTPIGRRHLAVEVASGAVAVAAAVVWLKLIPVVAVAARMACGEVL